MPASKPLTVGVLALQGAFLEHLLHLQTAALKLNAFEVQWTFIEVRNQDDLARCDALVIPGGESTTMSLVAERSGLLEPLREFVKILRKPTWGTCAGLILLAESANRTKKGGQELIGGLDVRVNRNHFGRQTESFEIDLALPFLDELSPSSPEPPFHAVFIRAPVVEKILPTVQGEQKGEAAKDDTVIAPLREARDSTAQALVNKPVEVLGELPRRQTLPAVLTEGDPAEVAEHAKDIVAVRQGNCFGTSFHPELTRDARIHEWWLRQVIASFGNA